MFKTLIYDLKISSNISAKFPSANRSYSQSILLPLSLHERKQTDSRSAWRRVWSSLAGIQHQCLQQTGYLLRSTHTRREY